MWHTTTSPRAVGAIPPALHDDGRIKSLVAGIEATQRELEVFAQHGITRIAAQGLPLDPNQHRRCLRSRPTRPGTVEQEMQGGYMIKDRVLRSAMVGGEEAVRSAQTCLSEEGAT